MQKLQNSKRIQKIIVSSNEKELKFTVKKEIIDFTLEAIFYPKLILP